MKWQLFTSLLLASSLLCLGIAVYSFARRTVLSSLFGLLMSAMTLWTTAYSLEILTSSEGFIHILLLAEYLGIVSVPPLWLLFTLEFASNENRPGRRPCGPSRWRHLCFWPQTRDTTCFILPQVLSAPVGQTSWTSLLDHGSGSTGCSPYPVSGRDLSCFCPVSQAARALTEGRCSPFSPASQSPLQRISHISSAYVPAAISTSRPWRFQSAGSPVPGVSGNTVSSICLP